MKKTLILFCLTVLCLSQFKAQTWCPPGATWKYHHYDVFLGKITEGTIEVKQTNTISINNIVCSQLSGTFTGAYIYYPTSTLTNVTSTIVVPISDNNYITIDTYENNSVLYVYNSNTNLFDTIVDFNATIGDSWFYSGYTGITCVAPRYKLTLLDTSHVLINGQYLKKLGMSVMNPTIVSMQFIERIGGISQFMYAEQLCNVDEVVTGNFSCYSDNNFPEYKKAGIKECYYDVVSIQKNKLGNSYLKFYPNPSKDKIMLELNEAVDIKIVSYLGAELYQNSFENSGIFEVDVSLFQKGIYFMKVITKNNETVTNKIIIE